MAITYGTTLLRLLAFRDVAARIRSKVQLQYFLEFNILETGLVSVVFNFLKSKNNTSFLKGYASKIICIFILFIGIQRIN